MITQEQFDNFKAEMNLKLQAIAEAARDEIAQLKTTNRALVEAIFNYEKQSKKVIMPKGSYCGREFKDGITGR